MVWSSDVKALRKVASCVSPDLARCQCLSRLLLLVSWKLQPNLTNDMSTPGGAGEIRHRWWNAPLACLYFRADDVR